MNNFIFKDSNGITYKRIDKRQAKKLYDAKKLLIFCPCNLRPDFYGTRFINGGRNDFREVLNNFEFYNCTNTETGLYTAFYVAI